MDFISSSPPDLDPDVAIWVSRFDLASGDRFPAHHHVEHQIAWSSEGVLVAEVEDRSWVLPPSLALFIPAGSEHSLTCRRAVRLHNLYLEPSHGRITWAEPTLISVTPLLSGVVSYLADQRLAPGARARAEAVLHDLLVPAAASPIDLRHPTDPRALGVARGIEADPSDGRTLTQWGAQVGASSRTLARLFVAETGVTFADWRALARLRAALVLLAAGTSTTAVAHQVGYRSASAFVERFRAHLGATPATFFAPRADESRRAG